jgi:general secretion pathway protein C
MKRLPLLAILLTFIALCASAAYWGMQLFKPATRPVAAPQQTAQVNVNIDAAAHLFGGRTSPVAVASNYQLKGIILAGTSKESIAILSTDGKPAQAITVNTEVAPGVMVTEVHAHYIVLSEGGLIKRVDLPEGVKATVGEVPQAVVEQPTTAIPQGLPGSVTSKMQIGGATQATEVEVPSQ